MAEIEDEPWMRAGVAATLARAYHDDQRQFLEGLVRMLEQALPGHVRVRRGGLFGRGGPVREIQVQLGDTGYTLADPGSGSLAAQRTLAKRGIVLKTDPVPVEVWIEELTEALQEQARSSEAAASALRRFVG